MDAQGDWQDGSKGIAWGERGISTQKQNPGGVPGLLFPGGVESERLSRSSRHMVTAVIVMEPV